jgi:hypothetical protein
MTLAKLHRCLPSLSNLLLVILEAVGIYQKGINVIKNTYLSYVSHRITRQLNSGVNHSESIILELPCIKCRIDVLGSIDQIRGEKSHTWLWIGGEKHKVRPGLSTKKVQMNYYPPLPPDRPPRRIRLEAEQVRELKQLLTRNRTD